MKEVLIYTRFERFWHWSQASLIMFLAVTGFEVHGSFEMFGFEKAVMFHRAASYALLGLIVFAIFWHLTTGQWRQYFPTTKNLFAQIRYYMFGMFKGEDHPTHKTEISKLNPLQRLVYIQFKLILIPIVVISGIFYLFNKSIDKNNIIVISEFKLETIADWHVQGAFLLIVFLIIHVYMTTTGTSITSNIKAMITGLEELESENKNDKKGEAKNEG
ncbi:MAG: cytochrome b/b6 domain-containing protein [Melioribacteraceae bacterium]|nr:cytochrome b/b6 domain-containing protein [Melioribacteraceae bacterium]